MMPECVLCEKIILSGHAVFEVKATGKIICEECVRQLAHDYDLYKGINR